MKILFTGGGTGGHFYPIIAIAQEIKDIIFEKKLIKIRMYFSSNNPYNKKVLDENNIKFIYIPAGKWRRYFSMKNYLDIFINIIGIIQAIIKIFIIYPDVVFSKGGYSSFPTVVATKILRIPLIIHESDSHPGRANLFASKFAQKIAISYPVAADYFPKTKVALTGNPLRREIKYPIKEGAHKFLNFDPIKPVIFILGGSQGSVKINEAVLEILPELLEKYQVIHQVGQANYEDIKMRLNVILENEELKKSYKLFPYLNNTAMQMAAGAADLIISRAGSTIFEIAYWQIPSIIIPIPEDVSHDQAINAYTYGRSGAAVIMEEGNLTPTILLSEINNLLGNKEKLQQMKSAAKDFSKPDAARMIAEELVKIVLEHEK